MSTACSRKIWQLYREHKKKAGHAARFLHRREAMRFAEFMELNTRRLHLRKISMADARDYYERLGRDTEVTKYMLFQPHKSLADSVASIEKNLHRYETGGNYRWVITRAGEDRLIGVIDLLGFDAESSSCSFAYMLGRDFWGQGYGTEALEAVLEFAFSQMEMESVTADHFAANTASGRAMEKAGLGYLGTTPGKYEKDGILHDAPRYAITRQQWEKRK